MRVSQGNLHDRVENGIWTWISQILFWHSCGNSCVSYNRCCSYISFAPFQIFYNCSCVEITEYSSSASSAVVGPCQKGNECPKMFLYFLVISVITSYTLSIGGTPGYVLLLRWEALILISHWKINRLFKDWKQTGWPSPGQGGRGSPSSAPIA